MPGSRKRVWRSAEEKGYFCGPRVLPLILRLTSDKHVFGAKWGGNSGQAYLKLLARDRGQGIVEIVSHGKHAYLSGYEGARGERTWRNRIRALETVGFIEIAVEDRFTSTYNDIQERTKAGLKIRDPERLILHLGELRELEHQMAQRYQEAIRAELPAHGVELEARKTRAFLNAIASLFIAPYGVAVGTVDAVVSGLHVLGEEQIADAVEQRIQRCLGGCEQVARRMSGRQATPLLTFVRELKATYQKRLGG